MNFRFAIPGTLLCASLLATGATTAGEMPMPGAHTMAMADKLTWGPAPPGLPPGSMLAVVSGDPSKAGAFTIRGKMPAGWRVPPHWHPTEENVTVLSGTVAMGMGETWDDKALMEMPPGAFAGMAAGTRHFFLAKTDAIIQVHGMGPFDVVYVNPADDPRKAMSAK